MTKLSPVWCLDSRLRDISHRLLRPLMKEFNMLRFVYINSPWISFADHSPYAPSSFLKSHTLYSRQIKSSLLLYNCESRSKTYQSDRSRFLQRIILPLVRSITTEPGGSHHQSKPSSNPYSIRCILIRLFSFYSLPVSK